MVPHVHAINSRVEKSELYRTYALWRPVSGEVFYYVLGGIMDEDVALYLGLPWHKESNVASSLHISSNRRFIFSVVSAAWS